MFRRPAQSFIGLAQNPHGGLPVAVDPLGDDRVSSFFDRPVEVERYRRPEIGDIPVVQAAKVAPLEAPRTPRSHGRLLIQAEGAEAAIHRARNPGAEKVVRELRRELGRPVFDGQRVVAHGFQQRVTGMRRARIAAENRIKRFDRWMLHDLCPYRDRPAGRMRLP